jgi:hypothetical protein
LLRTNSGCAARTTADDWQEEANRQARQLEHMPHTPQAEFAEFRRKLAAGEWVARSAEKLAAALRFTGRVTITFHQGKITKTLLEEAYFPGRTAR